MVHCTVEHLWMDIRRTAVRTGVCKISEIISGVANTASGLKSTK